MINEEKNWPPEYRLRKSRRAKHLQLKICPEDGLEVVVPYRFGAVDVDAFLLSHRAWIERNIQRYQLRSAQKNSIPEKIHLMLTNEIWSVQTISAVGRTKLVARPDNMLIIMGDITDIKLCHLLLKKWCRKRAQQILIPMLQQLSLETGLLCEKITIREQKTRWGSCASNGNIALNTKLIFLPKQLVRYVLIHELCHLRHFNHSKRFWALVSKFDPYYEQHKREISYYSRHCGAWGEQFGLRSADQSQAVEVEFID